MEPITRTEKLMAGQQLEPITRKELFLAKAAGMDVKTPEPITREEMFLNMITGGGGSGGGGGSAGVPWNDVTFIDYDGTVLHSYTLEEAKALTELPPLPEQKGLICQGWNWSLEDIKAQNGPVIVGAMYITDDGKTRIYITLHEGRTSPILGVCPKGTVTVDWGDGTEPDVLTGTSTSTVKWTPNHEYAKPGDYVISLSVDGEMGLYGSATSDQQSGILRYASGTDSRNKVYQNAVQKVKIGESVTSLGADSAFNGCSSLASIVIPEGVTSIGNRMFNGCSSLTSVVIPEGVTSTGGFMFNGCSSLTSVAIPESVTIMNENVFANCSSLASIVIPEGVTSIGYCMFTNCYSLASVAIPESVTIISDRAFYACSSLASIVIPEGVTSIISNAFVNCSGIRYYDFSACTSVPTLSNTNAFNGISDDCQMLIPSALFDEWSTATNWATYASKMVAV